MYYFCIYIQELIWCTLIYRPLILAINQTFKDFQIWYNSCQFDKISPFYEEILLFLLENSKGKTKENIRNLLENRKNLENHALSKQVLAFIKLSL